MSRGREDWQRVSKRRPCPVCSKPDWCLFTGPADAPTAAICARTESGKRAGEAGWLHRLRDEGDWRRGKRRWVRAVPSAKPEERPILDFAAFVRHCHLAVLPPALAQLAGSLGVSAESLRRLLVGWSPKHGAWTFAMSNAAGHVVGIRLRRPDGRKLAVSGGREGLFVPEGLQRGGRLLVAEGASDCAALLDLGFQAVGRPSCRGGTKHVRELLRRLAPAELVVVADADAPGRRGAEELASALLAYCPEVRVVTPRNGIKDARAWKAAGATRVDVEAVIDAAPFRRLNLIIQRKVNPHERIKKR